MKTIGLIGGMSWESSSLYYSYINLEISGILGKNHSAKCLMYSFDFQEIEDLQNKGDWLKLKKMIFDAGKILKNAGAGFAALCTNTMHKLTDNFEEEVGIPLLHIVDAVAENIKTDKTSCVGLLGTRFTMEDDFYVKRLNEKWNINTIVPEKRDRAEVDRIIYQELVKGLILEESRIVMEKIINKMDKNGAGGVILGCTEIGMLVKEADCRLYDSAMIHSKKAALLSLS